MPIAADDELQEIISTAREILPVQRILLFGSYARGDAHEHSDLNLCVVIAPAADRPVEEWPSKSWLYRAVELIERASSAPVAVAPCIFTTGEYDALRDQGHALVGQIIEEGRVVYEQ
jgi:predicted nucleotidyltransferase